METSEAGGETAEAGEGAAAAGGVVAKAVASDPELRAAVAVAAAAEAVVWAGLWKL